VENMTDEEESMTDKAESMTGEVEEIWKWWCPNECAMKMFWSDRKIRNILA
jgi:hypothetical protein